MRAFKNTCFVMFLAMLCAPMAQRATKLLPQPTLAGVTAGAEKPHLTLTGWFSGAYQRDEEEYFNERLGFRACFVRTYNQISFDVFGRIPGRRGTQIVIGKDRWLFERDYIWHYVRPGRATREQLEPLVLALRRLQDALAARGKAFVLVISPSKAEIYPERIPDEFLTDFRATDRVTDYDRLAPLLNEHGIRCVDAHRLFLDLKPKVSYDLYAKGGTHWNHYSIYFVLDEIVKTARPLLGPRLNSPAVESVALRAPEGADKDLGDLLNLWRASAVEAPTPYARVAAPFTPFAERPRVLVVGDSFAFTIIDALRAGTVAGKTDMLYYFKRHFDYPIGDEPVDHGRIPTTPLEPDRIDWPRLLLAKDLVILEVNEIFVSRLGWGFPEAACAALEQ